MTRVLLVDDESLTRETRPFTWLVRPLTGKWRFVRRSPCDQT